MLRTLLSATLRRRGPQVSRWVVRREAEPMPDPDLRTSLTGSHPPRDRQGQRAACKRPRTPNPAEFRHHLVQL